MLRNILKDYKLILGSGSPRRKDLLSGLGFEFTIEYNPSVEEAIDPALPFEEVPEALAKEKSLAFLRPLETNELLITADTLVYCQGEILGKPCDRNDAVRMLRLLSGNTHTVLTGVYIRTAAAHCSFTASTAVTFTRLSDAEIDYYIDNYNPYDKAGAYGAQDWIGYVGIKHIDGSYFNVMGLPVQLLYRKLAEFLSNQ